MTQGVTLDEYSSLPPIPPAFSFWATKNKEGTRKENEIGAEIRRIFIPSFSGHGICFLKKKKKSFSCEKERQL